MVPVAAVVIATGVTVDGRREVLGFEVGRVQLVTSDAHTGLEQGIGSVFIGVHRRVLAAMPGTTQASPRSAPASRSGPTEPR